MGAPSYDVIVIGGGPGGYVGAIRAAQLGMRVACVEKRDTLGGTCLNVGCIPSKALLQSSHHFDDAKNHFADHGIQTGTLKVDVAKMMARKNEVIASNTKGIDFLFKKNKVDRIHGHARLLGGGKVHVDLAAGGERTLEAPAIVLATGSFSAPLAGLEVDEKTVLSSTGALELDRIPETMIVIGAGVIGLELGSVWSRLGTRVQVIEYLDHVLPPLDGEIRTAMQKSLAAQGIEFHLGRSVVRSERTAKGVRVFATPSAGGEEQAFEAQTVLVAIGRRPVTADLGLEAAGVALNARGFVQVDETLATTAKGVYAIGDVIGGMMLAHKAEEEGVALMERLAGQAGHVDYATIPSVVYTTPEAASVGQTEEQLKADGVDYLVGKFPFAANGRAKANGFTDGFVKVLANRRTGRVLGCHIIGPQAGDLIMEAVTAMVYGGSIQDIAYTCHPHPQLAEAVKEAALAAEKRALHI
ncbi:dihydrolipoyl dehydrogenase [Phaeovibrio sulfidiphilus]|uniref:Dihydrolipoyl dehydrogenase n=1 Tax=Phaeovibrio sulfidiphilus TaxID=1220600 RepID=A0A8J7CWN8_9PROT|nr:dihydrolipoyl dehydrogenase [Phaeovibrio sulfidiphilus]MBE1237726.1 dihydrolipoyl dehydrogenase [Phaeovibrio sulfidiphilus]